MRKKMLKYAFWATLILLVTGSIIIFVFTDHVGQKMEKAFELRDHEKFEEAANLFGEIALVHPQSRHADKALFEQGFTYFIEIVPQVEKNQKPVYLKLAGNAFRKIIDDYQHSRFLNESLVYMAKISSELNKRKEAIEYYNLAIASIDDPVEQQKILFDMVRDYEAMRENQKAFEKLKEIIAIGAESVYLENAYLTLAGYYQIIARERPIDAQDAYSNLIQLLHEMLSRNISTDARRDALMLLAESYFELDRYDKCEEALSYIESLETLDKTFTLKETDIVAIEGYRKRIDLHLQMGK